MMVSLMLAGTLALAGSSRCPDARPVDVAWSHASSIAIRVRNGPFKAKREGDGETGERMRSGDRTIFIGYMGGCFSDWAQDVHFVCRALIDGHEAEIFRWKTDAQPQEPDRIGVVFVQTPMHRSGFYVDIPHDGTDFSRELDELLSVRFINDPRRLKLLRIDRAGLRLTAVLRNEVGEEFSAGLGDGVTRGIGFGRGLVYRIAPDSVRVLEYGVVRESAYVFSTRGTVRRVAVPPDGDSPLAADDSDRCVRRFDDQAIRRMAEKAVARYSLNVDRPYRIEVNWWECKYYATIWRTDPPPSPDSEVSLTFDKEGGIIFH